MQSSDEAQQIVDDLLEYLVALPTSYFEAKIQRAVGFEEFNTAVVPRGMRKDALQVLKDAGLKVKTYDPKVEGSRAEVIAKQKQLLSSHFLDLKETYMVEGKTAFNKKFNSINGLGRSTKVLLLSSFKEG